MGVFLAFGGKYVIVAVFDMEMFDFDSFRCEDALILGVFEVEVRDFAWFR